jgi:hypothetical protein
VVLSDLTLGSLYAVCGEGEGVEMLPPQVFRYEGLLSASGTPLIAGTLWWRIWVGRWFSGVQKNHWFAPHQVGIGQTNGRHEFHLELIDNPEKFLGRGLLYAEFLQDCVK